MKNLLDTSDIEIKLTVIKAIGNAGLVEFIPDVERIIKDMSQPISVRSQGVYALRRIAPIAPKVVSIN